MDQMSARHFEVALPDNMPLFKPSIAQLGLGTPPPSPEDAQGSLRQHHPRFPLPKFLRRIQPTRSPNSLAQNGEAPRVPENDCAPSHPVCPPFRAVQHMKEPFPLVLPVSPASSSHSANYRTSPRRLRKVPLSYQDLRLFPSNKQLATETSKPLVLLPSPVFSELQTDQISGSHFTNLTSNHQQSSAIPPDSALSLYDEDGIFSSYSERVQMETCHQNAEDTGATTPAQVPAAVKQLHEKRRDVGIVCAPSSFPQYQRHSQRARSRSYSSEANWLAGTMSEKVILKEWLSDLHESAATPDGDQDNDDTNQHQIMCATRLTGAGKPKIITISRPMSLSTTSTSILHDLRLPERPCTPTQQWNEISVFSPDTPIRHSQRTLTWSTTSLRPAPLISHWCRRRKSSTLQRSSSGHSQSAGDPLELSPTESQDTFATDFSNHTLQSPMRTPPQVDSPTSEASAWSRCSKLERVLEAASQAVDTFPDHMLRLDSPAILALRGSESLDEMHIEALQRIFPQTASLLLSALAALLLLDSYFSSMREQCAPSSIWPQPASNRKYGKLAARSNEYLHDIPMKARATLGLHLPNVTELQDHERALKRRADMVAACVRIQGQRLLEAICGRFDEVIWKALKVLVEALESNRS